jgi:sulfate transport system substrate-binding protein
MEMIKGRRLFSFRSPASEHETKTKRRLTSLASQHQTHEALTLMNFQRISVALLGIAGLMLATAGCANNQDPARQPVELLNASYDPTRELWRDLNARFIETWAEKNSQTLTIRQSHGGSATQARAIMDGLEADVATLALWQDTNAIAKKGLLHEGWTERLPNRSLPYLSTIVFVVRKGNPKGIKDWPDLVRGDVRIITPNPKTSGNGKLSLLAAYGSVLHRGGSEAEALEFLKQLYARVPVLDSGARGATTTFAQKKIGDVHLTWENEAYLEIEESRGELEIVLPSASIRAEPHVAVIDANVDRKGTRAVAEAYLRSLYSKEGQDIIARHHYRPSDPEVQARYKDKFGDLQLFPVSRVAKDWDESQQKFFAEGAIFDQIYTRK